MSGVKGVAASMLVASATACGIPEPAHAKLPGEAPPLPPPGAAYEIVEVDTAQELANACWNLESDQAIVIAPGTYHLENVVFPNGLDGRLTVGRYGVPPAQRISNVQIRGATGDPEDVVLLGSGMADDDVPFGFQIFTATDVLIADLSVGSVYFHAVAIQGDQGAERVRLYHVRLFDAGQQIVKGSPGAPDTIDDVVIEFAEVFYTNGVPHHPDLGTCYTNGIDALRAVRWIVRDSLVRGIRCQDGTLAGPAVLLWGNSSDSLVERNTFLDNSRGVSLGLGESDHTGGIVRNNFLRATPGAAYDVDVPIYTTSPGAKILHNTALLYGEYPNAIEARFASAADVEVRNNLHDAAIVTRDGATIVSSGNLGGAPGSWFADAAAGDLHLTTAASPAIDEVTRIGDAAGDFDGLLRPAGAGLTDRGADELGGCLFCDGFETGGSAAWSTAADP